jgi:hypothetical protein
VKDLKWNNLRFFVALWAPQNDATSETIHPRAHASGFFAYSKKSRQRVLPGFILLRKTNTSIRFVRLRQGFGGISPKL